MSWKTQTGETLQIVPNSNQQANGVFYDLVVDGVNFSNLPKVRDLGSRRFEQRSPTDVCEDLNGTVQISDVCSDFSVDSHQAARTSRRNLSMEDHFFDGDFIKDELHSELFSPVLEPLRKKITESLPQTEEMVSRSIIGAFFVETLCEDSFCSLNQSDTKIDATQFEADLVSEAFVWKTHHMNQAALKHCEDQAMNVLEIKMKDVFVCVRNKHLSSGDAARLLLSVAAVLGLHFALPESVPTNCIILNGLKKGTTSDDVCNVLSQFGKVDEAAVSAVFSEVGFCRFENCASVARALKASKHSWLIVGERRIDACPLHDIQQEWSRFRRCSSVNEERYLWGEQGHSSESDHRFNTKRKCVTQEERQISCATADCTEASVEDVTPGVITVVKRLSSW